MDDNGKDLPEITETEGPFEPVGSDSVVAPGAITNNDEVSSISSSCPDEEQTPRLKVLEIPVHVAEDSPTAAPVPPETQSPSLRLSRTRKNSDTPTKSQKNLRKRKRSTSVPIELGSVVSECATNGKVLGAATTLLGNGEYKEAGHGLADEEFRTKEEVHNSDSESFTSSIVVPKNADPSSQEDSRASSVVSEQPPLQNPILDAPVFHGHGKVKAAVQAFKLIRHASGGRAQEPEQEGERVKEEKEKERPVVAKAESKKHPENNTKDKKQTMLPPLVLPVPSTQPSLPSTSTSQSPLTPTSALPPSSPTVIIAPAEVTPPSRKEQAAHDPTEPDQEPGKKPAVKPAKRTASRKQTIFEPKSTRSQCRYRKISLPREENGPRVTFCVPQCSLNDKELMEEEEITDDGLATVRDFERLWDHVEEQNLSPYLIGVIRQLVGLDLLRENEVYYLPTDEEIKQMERRRRKEARRMSRRSIGGAANLEGTSAASHRGSVSVTSPTIQQPLSEVEKGKPGPPPSLVESISTTSTRSKADRADPIHSISDGEMSDGERSGRTKKRRTGKARGGGSLRSTPSVREDSVAPSTAGSPLPSQSTTERSPTRRSRKAMKKAVSVDARAYKPSPSSGESSEGEVENGKVKKKLARVGAKSLKRRRTEGTGDTLVPSSAGGAEDVPSSPRSTRSKRAKIDEN